MAITDTKQAKDFTAGAPDIVLKGDLRLKTASVDDPFYRDNEGDRDDFSFRMFNKPYKELNPEELEEFQEEMMRLMNKFSSYDYNDAMAESFEEFLRLKKIKEIPEDMEFDEYLDQLDIDIPYSKKDRGAPSMMMAADGGRAQYGLGSLVKGVKKAVKGIVRGVKDNPLLAAAAINFAPMLAGKAPFFGIGGLKGGVKTFFEGANPLSFLKLTGEKSGKGAAMDALKIAGLGGTITGLLADMEQEPGESDEEFGRRKARVRDQLTVQFKRLNPQNEGESDQEYALRINAMVSAADDQTIPVGEMADGGRVMRAFGSDELVEKASGIEGLPININSKGVKELDLRETGGFIPPVGVKEKADDIPAMLSNNEFVMTADAVRAAGGGSVNKGAQRMYDLMKNLESKVV